MGNRLAPILAILFLHRIENQAINADLSLSFFYRYIDDCIAPTSSSEEARLIQNHLNSQYSSIRYEIELPGEDGFLPFPMNDSGIVEFGWYTKPANKGLMLNAKSNHPDHVKCAVINNTINTYISVYICSNYALLQEAEQSFKTRAQRNGYNQQYVNRVRSKHKKTPQHQIEPFTYAFHSLHLKCIHQRHKESDKAKQLGHSSNSASPKFTEESPRRIKTLRQIIQGYREVQRLSKLAINTFNPLLAERCCSLFHQM
jgi:hypothetical protein